MSIGVQLNAVFNIEKTTYTANMSLPTTAPSGTGPFIFKVTSAPTGTPTNSTTLLTVAVGSANEVYVAVSPPSNLIAEAAGSDIVSALDVVVSEGTFDPSKGTFS
jgi:hypothetical protein